MKTTHLLLSTALLLMMMAAGCAVGPDYHRPVVSTPKQWSEPLSHGETNSTVSLTAWWKQFNDAELDSLINRAVKSNLDLRIAQGRVLEARAQSRIAAADLWPAADVSGSQAHVGTSHHQPVLGSLPIPSGVPFDNNVYQAGFDASWEIDIFGGKRREVEAAKAEVTAVEFGRRNVLLTLLGDVARNYVEVRGYQRQLAIANDNIKAQEEALAITKDRFTNGLTTDLDVQQARTLLATTRSEVPTLENALHITIHRLSVLLGQEPGALLTELSATAPIPSALPVVPVGLPSELLLRRPDVQQAERLLAAATANIGVARADLFPKFSLTGVGGFQSVSTSDWFSSGSKFWSIGPTVQWKIFDAGRIRANIKVQNARQEQALAVYERTVLSAFEDVENALVTYAKSQERRHSLGNAVNSAQDSLQLARSLYQNGLTGFLNVLDAERSLYRTQDQLVQSDRAVSANLIALYKALGGGWQSVEEQTAQASQTAANN